MDTIDPFRFIFAFLFVLGLIGILGILLKRYGRARMQGENGRLKIIETRYIDGKRKLVLIRRDNAEHLLLLADGRETVIESGIE